MPVSNVSFTSQKDPVKKVEALLKVLQDDATLVDATFKNEKNSKEVTRAYIEMLIEEIALLTQDQAVFNKFLKADSKVTEALKNYDIEIQGLLSTFVMAGQIQPQQMQQPLAIPQEPAQEINPVTSMPSKTPQSIGVE